MQVEIVYTVKYKTFIEVPEHLIIDHHETEDLDKVMEIAGDIDIPESTTSAYVENSFNITKINDINIED